MTLSNILQTPFYNVYISKKSKTPSDRIIFLFFFKPSNRIFDERTESILQLVTNVGTWCKPAKIFFPPCQSPFKRDVTVTYMGQIMLNTDSKHTFLA